MKMRRRPGHIGTFPKRGYQFLAPLADTREVARLEPTAPASGNMVGRQQGLAELDGYLQTALGGQRQVVFVTGELLVFDHQGRLRPIELTWSVAPFSR